MSYDAVRVGCMGADVSASATSAAPRETPDVLPHTARDCALLRKLSRSCATHTCAGTHALYHSVLLSVHTPITVSVLTGVLLSRGHAPHVSRLLLSVSTVSLSSDRERDRAVSAENSEDRTHHSHVTPTLHTYRYI